MVYPSQPASFGAALLPRPIRSDAQITAKVIDGWRGAISGAQAWGAGPGLSPQCGQCR